MAHEMAHFSGQDTTYSKKISPLLTRYDSYLQTLREGTITLPIFYFMMCFRALFELSLGKLSRQREFRADRIAAETVSPVATASALLRTIAYSKYRAAIEENLFNQEQVLETLNISQQIDQGFPQYAVSFAKTEDIGELRTTHPFDSHPPLDQRLQALQVPFDAATSASLLSVTGDGAWYQGINGAAEMEQQQWATYEARFREVHERVLAYRYLPSTPEEVAFVERLFPAVALDGKEGPFALDYEKMQYGKWPDAVYLKEITGLALNDGVLSVSFTRKGKTSRTITMKQLGDKQQTAIDAINAYYGRHRHAAEYHKQKLSAANPG